MFTFRLHFLSCGCPQSFKITGTLLWWHTNDDDDVIPDRDVLYMLCFQKKKKKDPFYYSILLCLPLEAVYAGQSQRRVRGSAGYLAADPRPPVPRWLRAGHPAPQVPQQECRGH